MTTQNTTVAMSTTAMFTEESTFPVHIMWIPYVGLVILFLLGLGFSFRRHHIRQIKKKQYILEYQEENLTVRRPRIHGKFAHVGDVTSLPPCTPRSESAEWISSPVGYSSVNCPHTRNYGPVNAEDVQISLVSDRALDTETHGVKKRHRSTTELDRYSKPFYRLVSEDDYFRRKGPRDSHYLRSVSERQISPGGHRQRIHDSGSQYRTFWVRSDKVGSKDKRQVDEAVKYIKVLDLDLCHDCRLYVERVDGGLPNIDPYKTREGLSHSSDLEETAHSCQPHPQDFNQDDSENYVTQSTPQISIAEVHAPPKSHTPSIPCHQFQTVSPEKNIRRNEIQLSPLHVERPKSAPDLSSRESTLTDYFKLGLQDSAFRLRPQFSFNPRRQSPAPQRRPRNRDRPGVFWLDLDTHQHTLV